MSIVDLLSKNEKKRRDALDKVLNKLGEGTISTTAPFRKGANILAQNYASAFTGKNMSQSQNQGVFLKYLSEALTPEEQQQINEKPLLEAVKSSAGMASTLMPASKVSGVSKLTKLALRGGVEGASAGLGYSERGKEVEGMLKGAGLGIGGEAVAGLLSNPATRKAIIKEFSKANKGKYEGSMNFARLVDESLQNGDRGEIFIRTGDIDLPTKTPKLKEGMSYSKQARLADRSKTAKRIPITSWDDAIKEALKKKRGGVASGKR